MQNEEQDRRQLYQFIVRQLEDDGYHGAATAVSNATLAPSNSALPPNRLQTLAAIGLTLEKDRVPGASMETYSSGLSSGMIDLSALQAIKGVDFDLELQEPASKRPYPNYQTRFITTHKNSVRCAKFSPDGKVIATGSADTSIKLLDVQKMVNYSQSKNEGGDDFQGARPVLRTLYDHTQAINDIDFHPTLPLLASASRDNTIKFYDYHSSMKKSFKYMQDSSNIRSISFHPSGDYIVAGTDNPLIRLYDINTLQCYVSPNGESNHLGPINQIRYGHDGKLFASCSKDGQIKLWDTVSFRCVQTFSNAHGGLEVNSVQFSKNGKYLLTCGKDASVKLWDLATARQLTRIMTGSAAQHNQVQKIRLQTCFSFNEDWILSAEENSSTVTVWDTRGAEQVQKLTGHAQVVRWIAASPVDPFIMTCSDDHRARFWVEETTMKK